MPYTVTNDGSAPYTYTIGFDFLSAQGTVVAHQEATVPDVGADRTVRRTVSVTDPPPVRAAVLAVRVRRK